MVGPRTSERRGKSAVSPAVADYRTAAPQLRAARIGIGMAMVAAVLDGFLSMVAAAVTGWAIVIDPAGRAAPLSDLQVSAGVSDLLDTVRDTAAAAWLLLLLNLLIGWVGLLRWQTAALANLPALGHGRPRFIPWSAAAAWVVPVWSLFGPLQIFAELWRTSDPVTPDPPKGSVSPPGRVSARHVLWWGLWLSAVVLTGLSVLRITNEPTLGTLLTGQLSQVVVTSALVGAGLLLLPILTDTTARQDARSTRF